MWCDISGFYCIAINTAAHWCLPYSVANITKWILTKWEEGRERENVDNSVHKLLVLLVSMKSHRSTTTTIITINFWVALVVLARPHIDANSNKTHIIKHVVYRCATHSILEYVCKLCKCVRVSVCVCVLSCNYASTSSAYHACSPKYFKNTGFVF